MDYGHLEHWILDLKCSRNTYHIFLVFRTCLSIFIVLNAVHEKVQVTILVFVVPLCNNKLRSNEGVNKRSSTKGLNG